MNILTMEHISKNYTERMLFDDANFSINDGDKTAIIGVNGTGKSTLLRIAAGLEEPDEGRVTRRSRLSIRYLPQTPVFDPEASVLETIVRENQVHGDQNRSSFELEAEAKSFLNKLGIQAYDKKMAECSGGERKRTALVAVLLSNADLLILDEPTNHLDGFMCEWLEERLKAFRGSLLLVTHDRYFLDSVANRIVEVDGGKFYAYPGNYEAYLRLRAERLDMARAAERTRQSILRKELAWMMRGAKARTTKQKGRIQRFEALSSQEGPKEEETLQLSSAQSRLGRTTVVLDHISKSYGEKTVIRDFSYTFLKDDRIGVVGHNGAGKSTFLKLLTGALQPDSGSIEIGQTVRIGYFAQEDEALPENEKVIDYIKEIGEYIRTPEGTVSASQLLERFLFTGAVQHNLISKLSGGEKRRLYLLRILMGAPNVLILDEPTNSLDIRTMTILEDYLDSFQGILLTVSHDRYFLDRTVGRIFAFEGDGEIRRYEGGYTDYLTAYRRQHPEEETSCAGQNAAEARAEGESAKDGTTKGKPRLSAPRLKMTYQEQRDFAVIDEEIAALEQKSAELDAQIEKHAADFVKLEAFTKEKEETEAALSEKLERWAYLNELAEAIEAQKS